MNHPTPWQVVDRGLFDGNDEPIGVMRTHRLAAVVVAAVNGVHTELPTEGHDHKQMRADWAAHIREGLQ